MLEPNTTVMKRSLTLLVFAAILLTACDVYYVDTEQPYRSRDRITGRHNVDEYSETFNEFIEYSVYISPAANAYEVYIDNFYGAGITVVASVSYSSITIPWQVVNGYEIEGAGTIHNSREITFNYRVRDRYAGGPTDFCSTTFWRN